MKIPEQPEPPAWHPLTPRGVAMFGRASWLRLLLVQFIFAVLTGASVVWFLHTAWFPTIRQAIQNLPVQGEILRGRLDWPGKAQLLSEGHFLAFVVDPDHAAGIRSPAHVQVEFGRDTFRISSLFGYSQWSYPRDWIIAFNRPEVQPRWGAWQAPILWITMLAALLWLLLNWILFATLYFLPAWLIGFFANRDLNFRQSWKLAGAALMPGALVMAVGIAAYAIELLDLIELLSVCVAHFVIGWVYLLISPLFAPRTAFGGNPQNPFATR